MSSLTHRVEKVSYFLEKFYPDLKKREIDVLSYSLLAFTDAQISKKLTPYISTSTIRTHRSNALKTLEFKNFPEFSHDFFDKRLKTAFDSASKELIIELGKLYGHKKSNAKTP